MGLCFSKNNYNNTDLISNKNTACCNVSDFERRVYPIIDCLELSNFEKNIIRKRYIKLVLSYQKQYETIHFRYNLCRLLISIGSMLLPTLQTIQNNDNVANFSNEVFWVAIGTSLTVLISNNIISMFSLDRRYVMYAITCEKLKSTGWQFFELSGIFMNNNHRNNYTKFWNEIEKIIKLQIIAEYNTDDKGSKDIDNYNKLLEENNKNKNLENIKSSQIFQDYNENTKDLTDTFDNHNDIKKKLYIKLENEHNNIDNNIDNNLNIINNNDIENQLNTNTENELYKLQTEIVKKKQT